MTSKTKLLNATDFAEYGDLAGSIADQLNAVIKKEQEREESQYDIDVMREDMLNNPEQFVSDQLIIPVRNIKVKT